MLDPLPRLWQLPKLERPLRSHRLCRGSST